MNRMMVGVLVALGSLAGLALAEPEPQADAPRPDACGMKRDGAACTEQDPIFQQAMEALNRERRAAEAEQGDRSGEEGSTSRSR